MVAEKTNKFINKFLPHPVQRECNSVLFLLFSSGIKGLRDDQPTFFEILPQDMDVVTILWAFLKGNEKQRLHFVFCILGTFSDLTIF